MPDDENFENELRRLRPRQPSRELAARIDRSLEPRTASSLATAWSTVWWKWTTGLTATAALAGAVALTVVLRRPPDTLLPVGMTSVEYAPEDEGIVALADGTPARRLRIRSIEIITWKNPRTEASLEWSRPSEEIRDVPLAFN